MKKYALFGSNFANRFFSQTYFAKAFDKNTRNNADNFVPFFQNKEEIIAKDPYGGLIRKGAIDMGFIHAFVASLSVVIVSELGDKTFFIAAIMAMRHSRGVVFAGAISALFIMTVMSGKLTSDFSVDISDLESRAVCIQVARGQSHNFLD